ncbi:MAG TPA: acyl-ACP--UDP-N-acetylglucosamine O-acyltransferase [Vicinamibacteria bacterium]|nr:acyl-ACP--UDP-N-acetylglucosamine O-acyltransferase [Vicinamibacteria bacterium]
MPTDTIDIGGLIRKIPTQYPFVLVDRVLAHDASSLLAVKNVTGSEEFFEGHFPGAPVMPGVLLMESLAQAAGIWLLKAAADPSRLEVHVVGIDGAKFRRPVVPGDELRLAITVLHRRGALCRVKGEITLGEHRVAEAKLLLQVEELAAPEVDPTARVAPGAILGPGVRVGAYCVIGPRVRLGTRTVLESQVTIAGDTTLGEDNQVFPFASLGHRPQDLKYHGEDTKLVIGDRNTFREGVTVHRGTEGGGGITRIGSDNLFMAQVHVAHDCRVGNHTIFANAAALSGHVEVQDWATLGGFAGVHQFCRVGAHAFMGGATIATKDVLPFSMTVGNRARIFGLNLIGLRRRGFSAEALSALKQAFRVLVQSRLNTTQALALLQAEGPHTPEVGELVTFIRESKRGVVLRRRQGSTSDLDES